MHHVANPVHVAHRAPVNCEDNYGLLYVGRFSPEKGPHLLAEAASSSSFPVVFVGAGELEPVLRGLAPEGAFPGWESEYALDAWMRRARALVVPSLWDEPLGLVVYEAAARGVPCICADSAGAAEFIRDGVNGLLFRAGDKDALERAIHRLNDAALVRELGRKAWEDYWAEPRTLARHAAQLEAVYRDMLARKEKAKEDDARQAA